MRKQHFSGALLKSINLEDAKARGLRAAFAAPPDADDMVAHARDEIVIKYAALDKFLKLDSTSETIWEDRARALLSRRFSLNSHFREWWKLLTIRLLSEDVPGFSVKPFSKRKHGAPLEWDFLRLAQLFSDVEYLRQKHPRSVRKICTDLPKLKGYKTRWGRYGPDMLRKAHSRAKALSKSNLDFRLELFGFESLGPSKGTDLTAAAISKHALKV